MKTRKTFLAALTIAGLLAGLTRQATASPVTPDVAKTVRTAEFNLAKPEDVEALYDRIRRTARSLCEAEHSAAWDVKRGLHKRRCFEQAVERAVARANEPALNALHRGTTVPVASR